MVRSSTHLTNTGPGQVGVARTPHSQKGRLIGSTLITKLKGCRKTVAAKIGQEAHSCFAGNAEMCILSSSKENPSRKSTASQEKSQSSCLNGTSFIY